MLVLLLILTYSLVMIVVQDARLGLFALSWMTVQNFNWYIFGLSIGIGILLYVTQKLFL